MKTINCKFLTVFGLTIGLFSTVFAANLPKVENIISKTEDYLQHNQQATNYIENDRVDVLLHLSSETETPIRSIETFWRTFQMITNYNPSNHFYFLAFMSMNQLYDGNSYDDGIAKYQVSGLSTTSNVPNLSNYRSQYQQMFYEISSGEDYIAVNKQLGRRIGRDIKIVGPNGNWGYIAKYRRYNDNLEFYMIQLTQTWSGYTSNKRSYKAISEMLMFIKLYYPGEYIITGDFNVQGHEAIFEYHLGSENYHIPKFYEIATCNDNEGLASPDGIVVSKRLYNRVEYFSESVPSYSYQHYIVGAKMYIDSPNPGTVLSLTREFEAYLDDVNRSTVRENYLGNPGSWSATDSAMLGSANNINEVNFPTSKTTYTAGQMYANIQ